MALLDTSRAELLDASDEQIEDAIGFADLLALRGLLYQLTGDDEVANTKVKMVQAGFGDAPVVDDEDDQALLRRKAVEFLKEYRDAGAPGIGIGSPERLDRSISLVVGRDLGRDSLDLLREELALDPFVRQLEWKETPDPKKLAGFSVTVVGAGMGGLNVALMLKRAGIPYQMFEKNQGVGGTWHENRYPGAGRQPEPRLRSHFRVPVRVSVCVLSVDGEPAVLRLGR